MMSLIPLSRAYYRTPINYMQLMDVCCSPVKVRAAGVLVYGVMLLSLASLAPFLSESYSLLLDLLAFHTVIR
jgi:hypothetical protein